MESIDYAKIINARENGTGFDDSVINTMIYERSSKIRRFLKTDVWKEGGLWFYLDCETEEQKPINLPDNSKLKNIFQEMDTLIQIRDCM